ncbi:unnamed protein product [Dracunculus medinensis]|uniref:C2H2-type domain-containing protein n=1 Tax=Dracunculus medinensis TaxID=318479 RepID=A0A0N4U7N6_DRAME|nr:unnamed protein product [Dracunculus medinensis]
MASTNNLLCAFKSENTSKTCNQGFLSVSKLIEHIARTHMNFSVFICCGCNSTFITALQVMSHVTNCSHPNKAVKVNKDAFISIELLEEIEDLVMRSIGAAIGRAFEKGVEYMRSVSVNRSKYQSGCREYCDERTYQNVQSVPDQIHLPSANTEKEQSDRERKLSNSSQSSDIGTKSIGKELAERMRKKLIADAQRKKRLEQYSEKLKVEPTAVEEKNRKSAVKITSQSRQDMLVEEPKVQQTVSRKLPPTVRYTKLQLTPTEQQTRKTFITSLPKGPSDCENTSKQSHEHNFMNSDNNLPPKSSTGMIRGILKRRLEPKEEEVELAKNFIVSQQPTPENKPSNGVSFSNSISNFTLNMNDLKQEEKSSDSTVANNTDEVDCLALWKILYF